MEKKSISFITESTNGEGILTKSYDDILDVCGDILNILSQAYRPNIVTVYIMGIVDGKSTITIQGNRSKDGRSTLYISVNSPYDGDINPLNYHYSFFTNSDNEEIVDWTIAKIMQLSAECKATIATIGTLTGESTNEIPAN